MAGRVGTPFFQKVEFRFVLFCYCFFPVSTHPSLPLSDHRCMYVTLEEKSLVYQKLFLIRYDDKVRVNVRIRVAKSVQ